MRENYEELIELAKNKGLSGKENVDLYISLGMSYKEIRSRINQNTTGHILENKDGFKGTLFDYSKIHGLSVSSIKQPLKKDIFPSGDLFVEHNGEYLKISELDPIFTLDQCKQLYKSGIKLDKLFKNIN